MYDTNYSCRLIFLVVTHKVRSHWHPRNQYTTRFIPIFTTLYRRSPDRHSCSAETMAILFFPKFQIAFQNTYKTYIHVITLYVYYTLQYILYNTMHTCVHIMQTCVNQCAYCSPCIITTPTHSYVRQDIDLALVRLGLCLCVCLWWKLENDRMVSDQSC